MTAYLLGAAPNSNSSEGTIGGAPSYAGITAGSLYRWGERMLGSVASNRAQQSGAAGPGPAPSISRRPDGSLEGEWERGERDAESRGALLLPLLLPEERGGREGNRIVSV